MTHSAFDGANRSADQLGYRMRLRAPLPTTCYSVPGKQTETDRPAWDPPDDGNKWPSSARLSGDLLIAPTSRGCCPIGKPEANLEEGLLVNLDHTEGDKSSIPAASGLGWMANSPKPKALAKTPPCSSSRTMAHGENKQIDQKLKWILRQQATSGRRLQTTTTSRRLVWQQVVVFL